MSATFFAGKELPSAQINGEDLHILSSLPLERDLNLTGGLHCQMCELLCSVPRCFAPIHLLRFALFRVVPELSASACDKRASLFIPLNLFPSAPELRPNPISRGD